MDCAVQRLQRPTNKSACQISVIRGGWLYTRIHPTMIPKWWDHIDIWFGSQRRGWPRSPGVSSDWSSEASVPAPHMWHVQNAQFSSRPRFFVISLCQRSHGRVGFGSLWCACSVHMIHHFPYERIGATTCFLFKHVWKWKMNENREHDITWKLGK